MQKKCRKTYNDYMHHTIHNPYQNGRKKFFQHVKSLHRESAGIPILEKDGIMYSTDISKANILNEHFYSIFTKDHDTTLPEMPDIVYPAMSKIEINNEGIVQLLNDIDPFKAMGPDELPSKLLKE